MNRFQVGVVLKMLVLAFVLIVIVSVLVQSLQRVRVDNGFTQSMNNLKQLSLSLHSFNDTYGKLPPATGWFGPALEPNLRLAEVGTVYVYLLPFIEQNPAYRRIRESGGEILKSDPPTFAVFLAPEDPSLPPNGGPAWCSYAANLRAFTTAGLNSKFDGAIDPKRWDFPFGEASIPASFPDGTARTIAFTTIYAVCKPETVTTYFTSAKASPSPFFGMDAPRFPAGPVAGQIFQTVPDPEDCNIAWTPQSYYRREITAAMFDGSVGMIRADVSPEVWAKLQHPADGDTNVRPWE